MKFIKKFHTGRVCSMGLFGHGYGLFSLHVCELVMFTLAFTSTRLKCFSSLLYSTVFSSVLLYMCLLKVSSIAVRPSCQGYRSPNFIFRLCPLCSLQGISEMLLPNIPIVPRLVCVKNKAQLEKPSQG